MQSTEALDIQPPQIESLTPINGRTFQHATDCLEASQSPCSKPPNSLSDDHQRVCWSGVANHIEREPSARHSCVLIHRKHSYRYETKPVIT
jgi:hypothetical protein